MFEGSVYMKHATARIVDFLRFNPIRGGVLHAFDIMDKKPVRMGQVTRSSLSIGDYLGASNIPCSI